MRKSKRTFTVECNMMGMDGVQGARLGIFCHTPDSFLDVAASKYLVATWASDYGAINLYTDDAGEMRGALMRFCCTEYRWREADFDFEDRQPIRKWLELAIEWCQDGGNLPMLSAEVSE